MTLSIGFYRVELVDKGWTYPIEGSQISFGTQVHHELEAAVSRSLPRKDPHDLGFNIVFKGCL